MVKWDSQCRLIGTDGSARWHCFVVSKDQADRWQGLGFDVAAAVDREVTFSQSLWHAAEGRRGEMLSDFYQSEQVIALNSGVPKSDPDFWRIGRAFKHYGLDIQVSAPVRREPRPRSPDLFTP